MIVKKLTEKEILADPELKDAALRFGINCILDSLKTEPNNIQCNVRKGKKYFKYTQVHPPIK
jgi:hypothetical protein